MKSPVRPELSTASVGACDEPTDAVGNSAPSAIRLESTYKSGKVVQTKTEPLLKQMAAFGISGGMSGGLKRLFASHPGLEERIAALRGERI